jgi:predicted acylesterase/phospholipase RssA
LNGGGVRALFQAHFLDAVSRQPAISNFWLDFDFIIGTSGGSLVAAGLCHKLHPADIAELIRTRAPKAFPQGQQAAVLRLLVRPRMFAGRRPPFQSRPFKKVLSDVFGATTRLGVFKKPMLAITATDLAESTVRVFTPIHDSPSDPKKDADLLLVDVLMASCALPGAFRAWRVPDGRNRYYVDGGMWANAPLLAGVALAAASGRSPSDIRVLSIGTGRGGYSTSPQKHNGLAPRSKAFYEHVFNMAMLAADDTAREAVKRWIGERNVVFIDATPKTKIDTWDTRTAVRELPKLAEERAQQAVASGELKAVIS